MNETDPKPSEPTAVFPKCPDCGRSRSTHLELLEVHRRNGYARSDCFTCRLTDIERKPFAPAAEALDPR